MLKISAVIITYNEEKNIGRCLESLQDVADEIVVIDSFSTDSTQNICSKYGANFIQKEWKGYSTSKNYGNSMAKYDWILSIDADEALSDELKSSILRAKQNDETKAYRIGRITNYCGTWIRHGGWYPDIKFRLFDRRKSKWIGHIHEKLDNVNEKELPVLDGDCYHYSYYSKEGHKAQADKFSSMAAEDLFHKGKRTNGLKIFFAVIFKFFKGYFLKLGLFDGKAGFDIAWISAHAVYLKYSKLNKMYAK